MDDGILERHGMACREHQTGGAVDSFVLIYEHDERIRVNSCSNTRSMSPAQARYLARKLYRLARRIEKRAEGEV